MSWLGSTFSPSARAMRVPALQWAFGAGLVCFLMFLALKVSGTIALTVMLAGTLLALIVYDKTAAILATIGYLMIVGDLRRIRDLAFIHPTLDSLLLVPPATVVLLALPLLVQVKLHDQVSKAMAFLLILMTLQIFNPSQGGVGVGLAGALFTIIPVLWFWLGRQFGTPALLSKLLYSVLLPLATAAALIGLYQSFVGPLPYQSQWFAEHPEVFGIFNIGAGKARPFGFFTSPQEYARIVSLGLAVAVTATGTKRVWILVAPILLAALVLSSIRSTLLSMIFALVLTFVLRKGKSFSAGSMIRLLVILIGSLIGLSAIAARFAPSASQSSNSAVSLAIAHEAGGLADPLNAKKSTAGIHTNMVLQGILEGVRYPIGHGLGYTTAASAKLGSGGMDTEVDLFDTFISLGLVGGLLYLYIVFLLLRNAVLFTSVGPRNLRLGVVAVLVCGLGGWIQGGSYSTAAIWMFLAGAITRPHAFPLPKTQKKRTGIAVALPSAYAVTNP